MTGDQWFEIARWIMSFAFWVAGAGVVIALVGLILAMFSPGKASTSSGGNFGQRILNWLNIAFRQLMNPEVSPQQKFVALGMVLFMAGLALLVIAIFPALVGLAQTAMGDGVDPTPTPTPSAT